MLKKILIPISLISIGVIAYILYPKTNIIPKIEQKIVETSVKVQDLKETIAPKPTKILSTGIPDSHLIKTYFIPQAPEKNWDQPWQDACEEAALLTVDYYYKNSVPDIQTIKSDLLKIFEVENQYSFGHDVNIDQLAIIANEYLGYSTQIIDNPTVEEIKGFLAKDIPVIIPASGKTLYQENKHFKEQGPYYHNLTILGYNDNQQKFIVHDVGTQFGAYFKYSYSLLMESIHDFPNTKNKQDINSGDKKILILLK
ncbi:MAG: C39 family peptidase [Candidatus Shapirobacteria bacterium]|nr:C39 family peptidase [Candidatus Shapirobacteria bacterium]